MAPAKHKDKKDKKKDDAKSGTRCAAIAKACVDLASHQAWLTDGAGHVTLRPGDAQYFSTEFNAPMP